MSEKIKPQPAQTEATESKDETIATLQTQIDTQNRMLEEQQAMMEEFRGMVAALRSQIMEREADGETIVRDADVDLDVLEDDDNFLLFKKDFIEPDTQFPEGRKLSWKSPRLRSNYGMRGWAPLKWTDPALILEEKQGDEIVRIPGGLLEKYIYAAPARMEGRESMTDHIIRGDLMLCWIDMRDWQKRMRAREYRANQTRLARHDNADVVDRQGVGLVGPGLTTKGKIDRASLRPGKDEVTRRGRNVRD